MKLPDLEKPIRLVGLTGSVGTGKSSAARAFAALSVPVDAGMSCDERFFSHRGGDRGRLCAFAARRK